MGESFFLYLCGMKKSLVTVILTLLSFTYAFSQGGSAYLYRGHLPETYMISFNGTYFWSTKDFQRGDIWYNGKVYRNVLMNIDAHWQEVHAKMDAEARALILYRGEVAWLSFYKGSTFVNLRYLGYSDAPEGYFEIMRGGQSPVFRQITKKIHKNPQNHNGADIGYEDPEYNEDVYTYFGISEKYYMLRDGKVVKIGRRAYRRNLGIAAEGPDILSDIRWHPVSEPYARLFPVTVPEGSDLPEGFFAERTEGTDSSILQAESQTATYRNKVYVIGNESAASEVTLTGFVSDVETGEVLPGVLVYEENTQTYVRTDRKGKYSIVIPKGSGVMHYSMESKEEIILKVDARGSGSLDVALPDKITLLEGSVISAQSMEQHRRTAMGIEQVSSRIVNRIPSAFGEGDVLKAVHMLPGVQSSGEAAGGINVRGGSPGENLILFNGNTIYNPSHLFGIFSSFNPDIIEGVDLYKGSVPAEFGGRASSVMDVYTQDGDPKKIKGSLGIGLLTGRFHLEGPIVKERTTFLIGARTTYSDWMLKKLPSSSYYSGASAGFTDGNAVLVHQFKGGDKLKLSAYLAADRFMLSDIMSIRYSNQNYSFQYRHGSGEEGSPALLQVAGGYDQYANSNGDYSQAWVASDIRTTIRQGFLRSSLKKVHGAHTLQGGFNAVFYALNPGEIEPYEGSSIVRDSLAMQMGLEPSLFFSDAWTLSKSVSFNGGLRVSSFLYPSMSKPYFGPELRLAGKYTPVENFSVKGGFDMMRQYIHLISNTAGISPTDTWRLSSDTIRPERAWQGALGVYWSLPSKGLDFSMESYWKHTTRALDYKVGAKLSMNPELEKDLIPVYGRAYGVEWMVKKPAGRLTGWMSYTYSRSFYKEMEQVEEGSIAGGAWYRAPFDKPHEFKAVVNWAMTHRYSVSANVEYSTGRPMTVPIGQYYYGGSYRIAYGQRNAARIPDYFRIDLALNIDPGHYLKALAHSSLTLGVYNVLGRKNPYSVFFTQAYSGRIEGHLLSVFATQVPYINLNILF